MGVNLMLSGAHAPVEDLLERSGVLESIARDSLFTDVSHAVLALSERSPDQLDSTDRAAVIARIDELVAVASAQAAGMTEDERRQLADAVARMAKIAKREI